MFPCYRIALLSDIHGSRPAFEAVLRDLEPYAPLDAILVAGDIIAGPHQQAVLQRLIDMRAVMIQGNNEQGIARLVSGSAPGYVYTAKSFSLARWVGEHLSAAQTALICDLPEQRVFTLPGAGAIRMVHGSPRGVSELVFPDRVIAGQSHMNHVAVIDDVIGLVDEPVIVFGHTHLQFQVWREHRLAVNPGAVSFPQNGYRGAQYALLVWDGARWEPDLRHVPYDLEQVRRDYQESGFLDCSPLARVFLQSILTGEDFLPAFFAHARHVAEETGQRDLPYYPDVIWDQAAANFPWNC